LSEKLRKFWTFSRNGGDSAPDPWLREALGALDPAERSPGYWGDFKRSVVLAARPELARRQRLAELTVSEVVFSWSRALVPAAMMAAATAGFLLVRSNETGPFVRLEEALLEGIEVTEGGAPAVDLEVEITLASESF
jgi:hypothetical protein